MIKATAKSTFVQGQAVSGVYCNVPFTGKLNQFCRPTPDYRNMIYSITLDTPIMVYGQERTEIEFSTQQMHEVFQLYFV